MGAQQSKEELLYQQVNYGNIEGIRALRSQGAGLEVSHTITRRMCSVNYDMLEFQLRRTVSECCERILEVMFSWIGFLVFVCSGWIKKGKPP